MFDTVPLEIVKHLRAVMDDVLAGETSKQGGICTVLHQGSVAHRLPASGDHPELGRLFNEAARSWLYFSGNDLYPLPGTLTKDCRDTYWWHQEQGTLWVGEQLRLRHSLARHVRRVCCEVLQKREPRPISIPYGWKMPTRDLGAFRALLGE